VLCEGGFRGQKKKKGIRNGAIYTSQGRACEHSEGEKKSFGREIAFVCKGGDGVNSRGGNLDKKKAVTASFRGGGRRESKEGFDREKT